MKTAFDTRDPFEREEVMIEAIKGLVETYVHRHDNFEEEFKNTLQFLAIPEHSFKASEFAEVFFHVLNRFTPGFWKKHTQRVANCVFTEWVHYPEVLIPRIKAPKVNNLKSLKTKRIPIYQSKFKDTYVVPQLKNGLIEVIGGKIELTIKNLGTIAKSFGFQSFRVVEMSGGSYHHYNIFRGDITPPWGTTKEKAAKWGDRVFSVN